VRDRPAIAFGVREAQREPALRVAIGQDTGNLGIYPDEVFAYAVGAVNLAEQALEFIVRNCLLEFGERFPIWRVRQGIAQVGRCENLDAEEAGEKKEESPGKDHGFDFGLFNTMLARC
jgi:hypothetical protein